MSGDCDGLNDGRLPYVSSDIADTELLAIWTLKVTGTSKGITALQMSMKVHGLPVAVLRQAIEQSKAGRAHILEHMLSVLQGLVVA